MANNKKVGRPTKMNETTIKKLVEMFEIDCTIEEACSQALIDPVTYHKWYNENKSFSNRIDVARNRPFIDSRHTLVKEAKLDWKAGIEFLKRRDKRYKDKGELAGEDGGPLRINLVNYGGDNNPV